LLQWRHHWNGPQGKRWSLPLLRCMATAVNKRPTACTSQYRVDIMFGPKRLKLPTTSGRSGRSSLPTRRFTARFRLLWMTSSHIYGREQGALFHSLAQSVYRLWMTGFSSRQGQDTCLFSTAPKRDLGPTQPPIQLRPENVFLGVKRRARSWSLTSI
jgi:hypothetical protein